MEMEGGEELKASGNGSERWKGSQGGALHLGQKVGGVVRPQNAPNLGGNGAQTDPEASTPQNWLQMP